MAADQKRWFKVWTSLLVDMDHLPDEAIGKWLRLGCRVALVGHAGTVTFQSLAHLAGFLRVAPDDVETVTMPLPNIVLQRGEKCNDAITVTFRNWHKYQIDSSAERVRLSRSKRRGDKNNPLTPTKRNDADTARRPERPGRKGSSLSQESDPAVDPTPPGNQRAPTGKGPLSGLLRDQLDRTWQAMQRADRPEP